MLMRHRRLDSIACPRSVDPRPCKGDRMQLIVTLRSCSHSAPCSHAMDPVIPARALRHRQFPVHASHFLITREAPTRDGGAAPARRDHRPEPVQVRHCRAWRQLLSVLSRVATMVKLCTQPFGLATARSHRHRIMPQRRLQDASPQCACRGLLNDHLQRSNIECVVLMRPTL